MHKIMTLHELVFLPFFFKQLSMCSLISMCNFLLYLRYYIAEYRHENNMYCKMKLIYTCTHNKHSYAK